MDMMDKFPIFTIIPYYIDIPEITTCSDFTVDETVT